MLGSEHSPDRDRAAAEIVRLLDDWANTADLPTTTLFDAIAGAFDEATGSAAYNFARAMLALDTRRARRMLATDRILQLGNRQSFHVLSAFENRRVTVPADILLSIMTTLRGVVSKHDCKQDQDRMYALILPALARAAPDAVQPLVKEAFENNNKRLLPGAASARAVLAGVEDAREVVWSRLFSRNREGRIDYCFDELTKEQQYYYLAFEVDAQVRNGGFSQFFTNPSGQHAALAPTALSVVGAPTASRLTHDALLAVGLDAREELERYRAVRVPETVVMLSKLDDAFYSSDEDILSLLKVYAADHPESFRG
jgi:hypothetical protein